MPKQVFAGLLLLLALIPAAHAWKVSDETQALPATTAYEAGDYAKAATFFKMLADKGNVLAQFYLGKMHFKGQHVHQSDSEGLQWYLLAAEQGYAAAQYELGNIYSQGRIAPRDIPKALRWYRAAAQQNYPWATLQLGLMSEHGQGMLQDDRESVRLYRIAAAEGNPVAQRNLGVLYGMGQGVAEDYIAAYMWITLALAHAEDDDQRKEYTELLEMARQKMSEEQIAAARNRADACMAINLKDC